MVPNVHLSSDIGKHPYSSFSGRPYDFHNKVNNYIFVLLINDEGGGIGKEAFRAIYYIILWYFILVKSTLQRSVSLYISDVSKR